MNDRQLKIAIFSLTKFTFKNTKPSALTMNLFTATTSILFLVYHVMKSDSISLNSNDVFARHMTPTTNKPAHSMSMTTINDLSMLPSSKKNPGTITAKCPFSFAPKKNSISTIEPPNQNLLLKQRFCFVRTAVFNQQRNLVLALARGRILFDKVRHFKGKKRKLVTANLKIEEKRELNIAHFYDAIQNSSTFVNGDKTEKTSVSFQLEVISRTIAEGMVMKFLKNVFPEFHPRYDDNTRDLIDMFMTFKFGMSHEQLLSNPEVVLKHYDDTIQHFQYVFRSSLLGHFALKPAAETRLAHFHQKMHMPPRIFSAYNNFIKEVVEEAVAGSNLGTDESSHIVNFAMDDFITDFSRAGIIHESFQQN